MADDISIRFGGDASGLKAASQQAQQSAQAFAAQARAQNLIARQSYADLKAGIDEANESLRRIQVSAEDTAAIASQARAVALLAAAYQGLKSVNDAAGSATGSAYASASAAIIATASAARSGALSLAEYAFNAFAVARQMEITALSTETLTGSISRQRTAFDEWRRSSQIYASGLLDIEGRTIAAAGNMDRLQAAAQARGFENATRLLQSFTLELTKVPGLSDQDAAAIQSMIGSIPNYTGAANASIVSLIALLASSGDEAKQMAASLTAALRDPAGAGASYLATLGGVSREMRAQFDLARQNSNTNQMQAAILSAMVERARAYGNEMTRALQEQLKSYSALGPFAGLFASRLRGEVEEANRITTALERQLQIIEQRNAALARTPLAQGQLADALSGTLGGTAQAGIDAANAKIGLLQQRLQGATGDAAKLVRQFEGFIPRAQIDSDGRYRVGFGSDTTTATDGTVSRVTAETVTTREDAERDLTRRIVEFQTTAANQVGAAWQGLSDRAKASLTSVAYNYGSLPASVAAAGRTGNEGAIAAAIAARAGDNGGVNAGRRASEASNVTDNAANEALRTQNDLRQQSLDKQAGGNALDREALATAQANAVGKRDEVAAQERANEALRQQLSATSDLSARTSLQTRLAQGEAALAERRVALIRSEASLKTAEMESSSAERLKILNDGLTREQGLYAQGSARWNEIEVQKIANKRTYEQAIAQEQQATEEASYRRARAALDEQLSNLRDEARMRQVSGAERITIAQGINDQIEKLDREHQRRVQEIWGEGTTQYRQAQAQLTQVEIDANDRRRRSVADAARAEYQDTRRSYEQIANTATSNAFSVIQGQTTMAQAAKNTAMSIVQSYVQAKVRLVADWLAGETTKTAISAQQEAARTGIATGGAAAAGAVRATSMLESIMASAAETFAGIFGFLSPVMGPAAVGPAAAGEATVAAAAAAVPSFAIGAWSLPSDMMANLHAGEMVVPAGPAAMMRAFAEGGGSGGGGGHTFNLSYNANGRMTRQEARAHAEILADEIAKVLNRAPSLQPAW